MKKLDVISQNQHFTLPAVWMAALSRWKVHCWPSDMKFITSVSKNSMYVGICVFTPSKTPIFIAPWFKIAAHIIIQPTALRRRDKKCSDIRKSNLFSSEKSRSFIHLASEYGSRHTPNVLVGVAVTNVAFFWSYFRRRWGHYLIIRLIFLTLAITPNIYPNLTCTCSKI